jgi:predicted ATP-grasp superfamily ATP-dependent carboligase
VKRIAVAAISARALAQAAAREGFGVIALDVFGDLDTRRAASRWQAIGSAQTLSIEDTTLLDALEQIARADEAQGWIAGSGFEGRPELLEAAGRRLPLIGNDAATLRRVRDPRLFFDMLDAHGVAHPRVSFDWPADARGWLLKDFAGSGGRQVVRADLATPAALASPTQYLQRWHDGTPLSATFIADGQRAQVLGCNLQLVREMRHAPFVWSGVIGGLPLSGAAQAQVTQALHAIVGAFGLRGLGSLDFLLREPGPRVEVLEVNPRPPASLDLYAAHGLPVIDAHLRACDGAAATLPASPSAPRGSALVFARREMVLGPAAAHWLAAQPDVHDLPSQATTFRAHDPVCSISAVGDDIATVQSRLAQHGEMLLDALETFE